MKFANRFDTKRPLVRRAVNGMARAYPRGVIAKLRALAVLATIVVACTTVTSPLPSPTELFTQSPFVSPTATDAQPTGRHPQPSHRKHEQKERVCCCLFFPPSTEGNR